MAAQETTGGLAIPLNSLQTRTPFARKTSSQHLENDRDSEQQSHRRSFETEGSGMTQNLLESHEATNPSPQTTKNVDYESAQQKQNYRQSKWRSLKDTWWLELTACIFSLACFVAIAAVLLFAHNRPLPSWHLDVSPNTVVSFIATVATSSFLFALSEVVSQLKWLHFQNSAHPLLELEHFDSASRGPLGSLNLVRRHHVRTKLASWAAVVVILSLLVSPFVQLIITFPTPTLPSGSGVNSTFGVASLYDPTSTVIDGHDTQMSADAIDTRMKAALISGFFNEAVTPATNCPNGNCTFTNITTMGVCGGCTDITANITSKCAPDMYVNYNDQCNYTMPSSRAILQGIYATAGGSGIVSFTRWNSSSGSGNTEPGSIAIFAALQAVQLGDPTVINTLPKPKGSECILALCTKTWEHINVTDGMVSSSIPTETSLGVKNHSIPGQCEGCWTDQDLWYLLPMTDSGSLDERGPMYRFNVANFASIGAYMSEMFSTGWWNDGTFGSTRLNYENYSVQAVAPDMGRELANSPNLTTTMQNIGARMTEVIRQNANGTLAPGTVLITQTYIEVQWAWLALPFTLVLMTLALLAITILLTHSRNAPAYKGSSLAMLFHRLEGWDGVPLVFDHVEEMDEKAKCMGASLSRDPQMAFVRSG